MKTEQHPGHRPGSTSPSTSTTPTNLQATAKLFAESYSALLALASDHEYVTAKDAGGIIDGLERRLHQCGSLDADSFRQWAESIIIPNRALHALMNQYSSSVKKGIWSVLKTSSDLGIDDQTVETLMVDSWAHVWKHLSEFLIPGSARYSTRLYSVGANRAKAWKTDRLRARSKFTDLDEADYFEAGFHVAPRSQTTTDGKVATRRDAVDAWLSSLLSDGSKSANDVKDAGKDEGIGRTQLEGAVERLGIRVKPGGFGKRWMWELPTKIKSYETPVLQDSSALY